MIITVPKNEILLTDEFLEKYMPYVFQGSIEENRREIKRIKNRKCRFCGKTSKEVTFKKDAHVIPKSLGSNRYFYAEECDNCNELFGGFEQNISNYLGVERTFLRPPTNKKIPSFESENGNVSILSRNGYTFVKTGTKSTDFLFRNSNEFKVVANTKKYIPRHFYLALLKIAMSIMPSNDIVEYKTAINLLRDSCSNKYKEIMKVFITKCNVGYDNPFALIFKRKDNIPSKEYPLHIFCLQVLNYSFQISFPLHTENFVQKENLLSILKAPFTLIGDVNNENISTEFGVVDFSQTEKQNRDNSITMIVNKESLEQAVAFNLNDITIAPITVTN